MWRKALRLCIPQDVNKMLIDPLGPWTDRSKHQWQWFFSPSNNRVYARHGNQWKVYKKNIPQGVIGKGTIFRYDTQAFTLPPHAQRATIVPFHNKIRLHGWSSDEDDPIPPEHDSTQWMIRNKYQLNHELGIANHLAKGEVVYAVSDGSYHPDLKHGTAAWIIRPDNNDQAIYGNTLIPGEKDSQCSHRSELGGLIGAVKHINDICQTHNITSGKVELGCDGEEAYKITTRHKYSPTSKISHHDLTTKIHHLINHSSITWVFRHARGHQNKVRPIK